MGREGRAEKREGVGGEWGGREKGRMEGEREEKRYKRPSVCVSMYVYMCA